ncbi:MAG: hypothetical protein FWC38_04135 [Proteobacteria bacterium]|nr:hypothetical protein [Pseudomonadota bacterium]MCL2307414.1 hypothetical protein [Pseudomonadota bacterium]
MAAALNPQLRPLYDLVKVDPDGLSAAEGRALRESGAEATIMAEIENALAEMDLPDPIVESRAKVRETVLNDLNALRRFTPDVNAAYADFLASYSTVVGHHLGMTPEAFFAEYGKKFVAAEVVRGDVFAQQQPPVSLEQATQNWHRALGRLKNQPRSYVPTMDTPTALRYFGVADKLALSRNDVHHIAAHPEITADFVANIPRLLHDPLFVYPYREDLRVVVDATTEKGEPIIVGVNRDGSIGTITPIHNNEGITGQERVALAVRKASETDGAKIYARNGQALTEARALALRQVRPNSAGAKTRAKATITLRDHLVKKYGDKFYQSDPLPTLTDKAKKWFSGKFGQKSDTNPLGAFDPNTFTTALGKDANLSTVLHETGHYFLENHARLANALAAKAASGVALTAGELTIVNDMNVLLKDFGVQDLDTWNALAFEEKRSYHEKFARAFEKYLYEGKAPNLEMQGLFQRFRAWLVEVYKNYLEKVELSDEVRGVMDRMLASEQQIQIAQEARQMQPMFETAEQAGMTSAEFADYQAMNRDATEDAVQALQARSLRNTRWFHNAHGREVMRLQKEAAGLRRLANMEATTEVMSQPVYQAWAFFTRKMTPEDTLPGIEKPTSEAVDQTRDSIFTAIAKLGGLDRAQVVSEWGIDATEKIAQPVFGKPVIRANGGLTLDTMAEALANLGYLATDIHGKHSLTDFEAAFQNELIGSPQFSTAVDYRNVMSARAGDQVVSPSALRAGRLDIGSLREMGYTATEIALLQERRMTAADGLHPNVAADAMVAEWGFDSGDAMVRALLNAEPPRGAVEARTDALMLERHGDLATPDAVSRAADEAIHNELRAKMAATEAAALDKALGRRSVTTAAAKLYAKEITQRAKIRNLNPARFVQAADKAAKKAAEAYRKGNTAEAAAHKRNETLHRYAAKEAFRVKGEVEKGVAYFRKFDRDTPKIDAEYRDQIDKMLERFRFRKESQRMVDNRESLAEWIEAQYEREKVMPTIPPWLIAEANKTHYTNLTVEQFFGLRDAVRQVEHLGRLKNRLLTKAENRDFKATVDTIKERMAEATKGEPPVDNAVRNTLRSKLKSWQKRAAASHRAIYSLVREFDGYRDGGPLWDAFVRTMNDAGNKEVTMRAEASKRLREIAKPLMGQKMGGEGVFFPTLGRSLNLGEKISIALNYGNEGNRQRLLDGYGWTPEQVAPVLRSLTKEQLNYVQALWDFFEGYRPEVAAKERRVYGKEPEWVEPAPFTVTLETGETVEMRGGYFPIKYDPNQSALALKVDAAQRAKEMMQDAYTAATTRRSYTKTRAHEVRGQKLALSPDVIATAVNEMIHDLSWHEWLIDANKLMRSLGPTISERFGSEKLQAMKKAMGDIAKGDGATYNTPFEKALVHLRNGSTVVGLGWNLRVALLQPFGITNAAVYTGGEWIARGLGEFYGTPEHMLAKVDEVNGKSEFMRNRARTMNREINDVVNRLYYGKSDAKQIFDASHFWLIQKTQAMVDYPVWLGAYQKAAADPANLMSDGSLNGAKLVALADQAVITSQSSGMTKDLAAIQRGDPMWKLFTNFYSFFSTTLQVGMEATGRTNFHSPMDVLRLANDYLLIFMVPAMADLLINAMLGKVGSDDDLFAEMVNEQLSFLLALNPVTRELGAAAAALTGTGYGAGYSGPAALRFFGDSTKLMQHVAKEGEPGIPMFKSANNVAGALFHYPAGQINKTVEGTLLLIKGETDNPMAVFGGRPKL